MISFGGCGGLNGGLNIGMSDVVITPGTCECDLIWKKGLCRCN